MRNLIIILLFSFGAYGQQDLLLASIQQAGGGITNLYTFANAANPDSEVNATTGFTVGTNSPTITSTTTSPHHGTYRLELTAGTIGANSNGTFSFSNAILPPSTAVTVKIWAYEEAGTSKWNIELPSWGGWASTIAVTTISTTVWTEYTLSGTTTGSAATRYILIQSDSDTPTGRKIFFDDITVTIP